MLTHSVLFQVAPLVLSLTTDCGEDALGQMPKTDLLWSLSDGEKGFVSNFVIEKFPVQVRQGD